MKTLTTALLVAAVLAVCPGPAAAYSTLHLKDSSLLLHNTNCSLPDTTLAAYNAISLSNTEGMGFDARSEFSEAYMCNNNSALCGSLNPLQSSASIEANNTFILVNSSQLLANAYVKLVENNTLIVKDTPVFGLESSTLDLLRQNWLNVLNSTLMANNTRLNLRNYFDTWISGSSLGLNHSIIDSKNSLLGVFSSSISVFNSTWKMRDTGLDPPGLYADSITPLMFVHDSLVRLSGSYWELRDLDHVHWVNSSISLSNSKLRLVNSELTLWNTSLFLDNNDLDLVNSTLHVYCGSLLTGDSIVTRQTLKAGNLPPGQLGETGAQGQEGAGQEGAAKQPSVKGGAGGGGGGRGLADLDLPAGGNLFSSPASLEGVSGDIKLAPVWGLASPLPVPSPLAPPVEALPAEIGAALPSVPPTSVSPLGAATNETALPFPAGEEMATGLPSGQEAAQNVSAPVEQAGQNVSAVPAGEAVQNATAAAEQGAQNATTPVAEGVQNVTAPAGEAAQNVTAPAAEAAQNVTAPVGEAAQNVTAPAGEAAQNATAPAGEALQNATAPSPTPEPSPAVAPSPAP
jgi:hypothetical protein